MLRSYKYRIYPTDEQKVMLAKTFGCCRYVYNWALERNEKAYREEKKSISQYEMSKLVVHELKTEQPWLREVSAKALEFAVADLYSAYTNFFRGRANRPKWRIKNSRQHYHDSVDKDGFGIRADFDKGLVSVPKIKNIPCVFHRRFNGRIKQACIELVSSGAYRISILVDDDRALPVPPPIDPDNTIGIDTGIKHFAVLSNGQTFESGHFKRKEKQRIKLLNRRLFKKEKGSRMYRTLKHRFAKLQEKIANRRHDQIHKITHYLAYENQATTICVEDLNVYGMRFKKHLGYEATDSGIGYFYRKLEYKCAWAGKNYIKIDRWAPSSKTCSHCGYVLKHLPLQDREWTCPVCGTHHDRDLNAAINIKHFGLSEQKTLPSVRRKVTPVEQPLVDDRSSEPKKLHRCYTARRVRADETGKVRGDRDIAPMPHAKS